MSARMCLLVFGSAAALLMPMLLPRLVSRSTSPGVALFIWLPGSLSVIASWALLGGLLPNPTLAVAVVGAITGRLGYAVIRGAVRDHRRRNAHAQAVRIVGHEDPALGATILRSEVPAVYCLAGRPATIVVTSAARGALRHDQLCAALAHEHAHLTGRHHLILVMADAITWAFPGVPPFGRAARETRRLVEVLADDAAANRFGRRLVAEALMRLACARTPAGALAAGEPHILPRVERLLSGPVLVTPRQRLGWIVCMAVAVAGPLGGTTLSLVQFDPFMRLCSLFGL